MATTPPARGTEQIIKTVLAFIALVCATEYGRHSRSSVFVEFFKTSMEAFQRQFLLGRGPTTTLVHTLLYELHTGMLDRSGSVPTWKSLISNWTSVDLLHKALPQHILLLGDNVDRNIVDDLCSISVADEPPVADWTQGVFRYKEGASAAAYCQRPWGSVAFVHLYGASPRGPYLHDHVNTPDDPYTDTILRIEKSLSVYKDVFLKSPDMIVYQSNLWDEHLYRDPAKRGGHPYVSLIVQKYLLNMEENIRLIRKLTPADTLLLLRTTPTAYPILQPQFNAAIRLLGHRLDVGVVDWEVMAIRAEHSTVSTFRDFHHPNEETSRAFGIALLSLARQYAATSTSQL